MVKVTVKIEAYSVNDPWVRSHAKGVDQPLDNTGHWQDTQPEKFLGYASGTFTHEQTIDLPTGTHYVEYAASGYVPDYMWHAKIYINGELKAEGDVGRATHLKATFTVGAPPPGKWWERLKWYHWLILASLAVASAATAYSLRKS